MRASQPLLLGCLLAVWALASSTASAATNKLQRLQPKYVQQPQERALRRRQVAADDNIDDDDDDNDDAMDDDRAGQNRGWIKDCLRTHNKYRKLHGAPALTFSRKIARFAQKRASHIAASDGAEFKHPPNLPYGENLAWHSWSTTSCNELVRMWYDEISMYNFQSPGFAMGTGHFTQLVWQKTKQIGCARGISKGVRGGVTLVCNYLPAGNMLGTFKENVKRPIGSYGGDASYGDAEDDGERQSNNNSNKKRKKNQTPVGPQTWTTPFRNPVTSLIESVFGGSSRSGLEDDVDEDDRADFGVTKPYKKPISGAFTESPFASSSPWPPLSGNQSGGREGRSFNFGPRQLSGGFRRPPSTSSQPPPPLPVTRSYLTRTTTHFSNSTTTTTTTSYITGAGAPRRQPKRLGKKKATKRTKKLPKPSQKPALAPPATSARPKLSDATGGGAAASKSTTTTTTTKKPAVTEPDSKPSSLSNAKENDQLKQRNLATDKDKSSTSPRPRARKRRRRAKNNARHNNSTSGGRTRPPTTVSPRSLDSKLKLTSLPTTNTTTATSTGTSKRPSSSSSG